jgi:hypothetical protein
MISVVALSSPANAVAPAISGDASAFGREENVVNVAGANVDSDDEWDVPDSYTVLPIGGGAPILIASSEPVAPEPAAPKIVKPLKQMPPKCISTQELVVRIVSHFRNDYLRFKNQGVNFDDGTDFNLRDQNMKDPQYGFIGYAMVQAETYYGRIFGNKVSLSKIRSDIDTLQSQLRVSIAKKDAAAQVKLCVKLDERKAELDEAIKNIELAKLKKSPLDDVRAAIAILRRENDSAYRFCKQFTLYNATGSFEKKVEAVDYAEPVVVVVTKKAEPKMPKVVPVEPFYVATGNDSWWDDEPVEPVAAAKPAAPSATVDAPVVAPVKAQVAAPVAAPVSAPPKKNVCAQKKLGLK